MTISGVAFTAAEVAYAYDDAYQLTGEVRTGGSSYAQVFCYDASGNRTKSTLGGVDTTYIYNEADQLTSETTSGTTTTYAYDANGALTKADDGTTVQSYEYNCEGRMTAYAKSGGSTAAYAYDADGRRIAKTVDAATTKFFYDGSDAIADYDGSDTLIATYLTPGLDANLSQTRSGSTYYYMRDGLGSIRNLVDSSETTQNTYDYYAFGKELGSWTEGITNRYTYTAREWDEESAQYYYRARYYDGGGRFLSRDPARDGLNCYEYVSSSPLSRVDPRGRESYYYRTEYPALKRSSWGTYGLWPVDLTYISETGQNAEENIADAANISYDLNDVTDFQPNLHRTAWWRYEGLGICGGTCVRKILIIGDGFVSPFTTGMPDLEPSFARLQLGSDFLHEGGVEAGKSTDTGAVGGVPNVDKPGSDAISGLFKGIDWCDTGCDIEIRACRLGRLDGLKEAIKANAPSCSVRLYETAVHWDASQEKE